MGRWKDINNLRRISIRSRKEMQKSEKFKLTESVIVFPSCGLSFLINLSHFASLKITTHPTFTNSVHCMQTLRMKRRRRMTNLQLTHFFHRIDGPLLADKTSQRNYSVLKCLKTH